MFLKHPAWLWLKKHRKEILPEPSPALQARFYEGHLFESYAEQLFDDVTSLGFANYQDYLSLPRRTRAALEAGAHVITQGRFEAGPITCIVDLLRRVDDTAFDLFEIKSSTGVKEEHLYDLAFQRVVLEDAGFKLRKISVLHVDKSYVRAGAIDAKALTALADITDQVNELTDTTRRHIARAVDTIDASTMPDPSPRFARLGAYQEWLEIYERLSGPLPADSIYRLPQANGKVITELEQAGLGSLMELHNFEKLNTAQRRFVEALQDGRRRVDRERIAGFLGGLRYPLTFLDYETSQSLIPPFDGTRPYQQLPFQYSLHIQETPDGPIQHRGYLHHDKTHPVPHLLQRLMADLPRRGSVLVWYQGFEKTRNAEMAEMVPEHAAFFDALNARVVDLMEPFKHGWVIDKDFGGSNSIKKVLPVLVPDLSYDQLDIQEGETASRLWKQVVIDGQHAETAAKIFRELDRYCALDTWAMVRIYQVLGELVLKSTPQPDAYSP